MPTLPRPPTTICRVLPPHPTPSCTWFTQPAGLPYWVHTSSSLQPLWKQPWSGLGGAECHFAVKGAGMKGSWACNQSHPANSQIVPHFTRVLVFACTRIFQFCHFSAFAFASRFKVSCQLLQLRQLTQFILFLPRPFRGNI